MSRVLSTGCSAGSITLGIVAAVAFLTGDRITDIAMAMTLARTALLAMIVTATEVTHKAGITTWARGEIGTAQANGIARRSHWQVTY